LKNFNFNEVETNVFVHQDNLKTIEIVTGKKGLNLYLDSLEKNLLKLNSESMSQDEFDFQQNKLLNEIDLYQSKLNSFQELKLENKNSLARIGSFCYPHLYQNYTFNPSWYSMAFTVESSYPMVPGPFPPNQSVTIHATSKMTIIQSGGTQYSYAHNSYTGGNIYGGAVSATSYNTGFVSHGNDTIYWDATSVMSQSNCFEYIHAYGNYE